MQVLREKKNRTIGGWGGKYTNVTTLNEFTAAVSASGSGVVVVHGNITGAAGNTRVTVGSTKTILGWPGSCEFFPSFFLFPPFLLAPREEYSHKEMSNY